MIVAPRRVVSSGPYPLEQLARSTRAAAFSRPGVTLLLLCATFFAPGCQQRPSEEECLRSFENFLRLSTGAILSEADIAKMAREATSRDMAAEVCTKKKSRARVLCEIEARSVEELKACNDT